MVLSKESILKKLKAIKSISSTNWVKKNKELTIALIIVSVIFVDISNFDSFLHKTFCSTLTILLTSVVCPDYYDIPIWSVLEVSAVLATVIVALWSVNIGLKQANKQEKKAQEIKMDQDMPIIYLNPGPKLHKDGGVRLDLMNVGKGIAKDVYVYLEGIVIDGNFTMHTFSPNDSSKLEIKSIDSRNLPDIKSKITQKIQQLLDKSELKMTISYCDIYGRKFITDQIVFEKDQVGDYMHNRGKWTFRRDE